MTLPDLDSKVALLSRPDAYPDESGPVERRETHMSWVFLTASSAWKLKKPVCNPCIDLRTPQARRANCEEETRLNRRLAPDVYRGVVPLTLDANRRMRLNGEGAVIDWLVHMRRLPTALMLDRMISEGVVRVDHCRQIGEVLARFYALEPPVSLSGEGCRKSLLGHIGASARELGAPEYGLPPGLVASVTARLSEFVATRGSLLDDRVRKAKIVEGHGDLRPEHICLEAPPVIVDCLEFSRELRTLDAASDIAFLALECDRLGAPELGDAVIEAYGSATGDRPANVLMAFYRGYHAVLRAKVALWHLGDPGANGRGKWIARALWYLRRARTLAEFSCQDSTSSTTDSPE